MNRFSREDHVELFSSSREYYGVPRRRYGFIAFAFDCIMVGLTCGFWLIWIFVREMRKR